MRTLVIGSGAVGSVLAGYLRRGGRDVTIADGWPKHVEAVRARGLRITPIEDEFTVDLPAIHLDGLASFGTADLVIVASKSYDTRMLSLLAREHMHEQTVVMSAQNGMNDVTVAGVVGREHVMACVVALGADLIAPGYLTRSSATTVTPVIIGHIEPGRDQQQLETMREHFSPLGAVKAVEDIWPERWGKLTLNSMSNALGGLTGLRSNTMWSENLTLDVMVALGHETAAVAAAADVASSPVLGTISQSTLINATSKSSAAWQEATERMREIGLSRVGPKSNRASLLQDIEKGRRTEIHYLNGWIAAKGTELGVPTPTHSLIVEELAPVERGDIGPSLANAKQLVASVHEWYG